MFRRQWFTEAAVEIEGRLAQGNRTEAEQNQLRQALREIQERLDPPRHDLTGGR